MKAIQRQLKINEISLISKTKLFIIIAILNVSLMANSVTVTSLAALKPYLSQSNVSVNLAPGTYTISSADVQNGLYPSSMSISGVSSKALFLFNGNNSTYDFTGVTIKVATAVFKAYGSFQVYEVHVIGNNNVLKNLTLIDDGTVNDNPTTGAVNVVMDGAYNKIEGFYVRSTGSYPYGYGDTFGKGGTGNIISHRKHSTFLIRGNYNYAKNCTLIHRTYGHCMFMQAANHPTIEGCYVEGEVRKTDDMLAEKGTGTPGDKVNFLTTWGYTLPAGYMMSLGEEGIRAYNAGETIVDGVEYSRGTNDITVLNSTVKYMRGGVTIKDATGTKYVEGCTVLGCEQGYALGTGNVVKSFADVAYGPAYQSTYDSDSKFNADITILSASSYYNGSKSVAYIGSSSSTVTLRAADSIISPDLKVEMGGDHKNIRFLNGNNASQNNHTANNDIIYNYTNYPISLPSGSSGCTGQSAGIITNSGTSNTLTKIAFSPATVSKQTQSIYFPDFPFKTINDIDFSPGASSYSGLTVSYSSSNTDVASIVNGKIHIVGTGTSVITATQDGDNNFNAATSVDKVFTVSSLTDLVNTKSLFSDLILFPNNVTDKLTIKLPGSNFYKVEIIDSLGKVCIVNNIVGESGSINTSALISGVYFAKISEGENVITKKFIKK